MINNPPCDGSTPPPVPIAPPIVTPPKPGGGGGAGKVGPPNSKLGCPTTDQTAAKSMKANFDAALAKQRAGGVWEAAGYLYQSDDTGQIYDQFLGDFQLGGNGITSIPSPSLIPGFTLIGWYHIHPDLYNFDNGNGMDNGSHFSQTDLNLIAPPSATNTQGLGVPGYVAEYNDIGVPGSDQQSLQWYSRDPNAKKDTSHGPLTAASGC